MATSVYGPAVEPTKYLTKKINDIKDIHGQSKNFSPSKYEITNVIIKKCSEFLDRLGQCCDETDLKTSQTVGTTRFGLSAFRDWFDKMKQLSYNFIKEELIATAKTQFKEELSYYLTESFGNRMRIDYGTGHELNFIIFMMGLCDIIKSHDSGDCDLDLKPLRPERLTSYIKDHGFDLHTLFSRKYISLCRKVQSKFRLEPAGSRGVYNMDDYQFLPFLFGAAQLCNTRGISVKEFYNPDMVEMFRQDYIFFEAIDFILKIKRGPFNEHSYTLWNYSGLGTWDNIYRRIRSKFNDEVLSPFPIVQHLLFGEYILCWD